MFNFFRRKRGSIDNLVDIPEKMPSEDDVRLTDENENVENECGGEMVKDDQVCKEEPAQVQKRVRWAEVQTYHELSDNSTQESSSEEEEENNSSLSSEEETDDKEDEDQNENNDKEEIQENSSENMEELNQLRSQLCSIERDMTAKSNLIDRLQTELREAYQDAEIAKIKMSNLQLELEQTKNNLERSNIQSDSESEDEEEKVRNVEKIEQCEQRIKELELELEKVRQEKQELETALENIKTERHQEITALQKAYEETLKEQDEMMIKFEEDFEELRTLNSRREQQLLEDFEWKLREVEKQCKLRVEKREKDKDKEISELVCQLAETNVQLQEANKLKVSKEEFEQTKQSNIELKRNLRQTNRKLEEVQVSEKVLQEETSRLRIQIDKEKAFTANLQMVHREELDERERKMNFRLDAQKNNMNSEWEDRLKRELRQLRLDLDRKSKEETNEAVEEVKKQLYHRIANLRKEHDEKSKELQSQVEDLKKSLSEKDIDYKETIETIQTNSDSQLMELRRKMEKLYMSYEDKIEKLNEQHEQQLNKLQEECDKRVQQVESNLHMQAGTTRATVELVKEQLHRDNQSRLQQLENQHQRQLEEQWCRMNKDKEDALRVQDVKHKEIIKKIQLELEQLRNNKHMINSSQLTNNNNQQKLNLESLELKDESISSSLEKLSQLQTIATVSQSPERNAQHSIRAELGEAEANLVREKERLQDLTLKAKMCQTIQQLTIQLEASKKEIEVLHSKLNLDGNPSSQRSGVQPRTSAPTRPLTPPTRPRTPPLVKEPQATPIPTARVQPQTNQQQTYNQSRRNRKHRSRRH